MDYFVVVNFDLFIMEGDYIINFSNYSYYLVVLMVEATNFHSFVTDIHPSIY